MTDSWYRDRSSDYYRRAIESDTVRLNEARATPDTIVRNGDRISNIVHRHEPPVVRALFLSSPFFLERTK